MELDRRVFLKAAAAAVLLPSLESADAAEAADSTLPELDATFKGRESQWTFYGSLNPWREDDQAVLLSPTWCLLKPGYYGPHTPYVDDLTREDYAFLEPVLGDTDFSTDFQMRYGVAPGIGVAVRALDNQRCYVIEVRDTDARKANAFDVNLWRQDEHGFRRQIAGGQVERAPMSDRIMSIRRNGPKDYDEWVLSSGPWARLRVRAIGSTIEAWIDGKKALEAKAEEYPSGRVALIGCSAVAFRKLSLRGQTATLPTPWKVLPGVWPAYFEPLYGRVGEFEVFQAVARDDRGTTYVIANVGADAGGPEGIRAPWSIGLVRSRDEGRTWIDPQRFDHLGKFLPGGPGLNPSLYAHKDGRLSCFYRHRPTAPPPGAKLEETDFAPETIGVSTSHDGGYSWSPTEELIVSGKPLSAYSTKQLVYCLYSPVQRLKNGTLLMSGYSYNPDDPERGSCVIYRSTDDGETWTGPFCVDLTRQDTDEGMVAELPDGRLQAFMRPSRTPYIYTAYSSDGGIHWSDIEPTDNIGLSPYLLNHSSGAIILAFRGSGIDVRVSRDGCKTWGPRTRISPASGMIGMTEMADGRLFITYNIGYRFPGKIEAQYLHVRGDTVEPAP